MALTLVGLLLVLAAAWWITWPLLSPAGGDAFGSVDSGPGLLAERSEIERERDNALAAMAAIERTATGGGEPQRVARAGASRSKQAKTDAAFCTGCGKPARGARFCPACGRSIGAPRTGN